MMPALEATRPSPSGASLPPVQSRLEPAEMARFLRRTSGDAVALCFARTIHADSAWANEEWGQYWAAVVRAI